MTKSRDFWENGFSDWITPTRKVYERASKDKNLLFAYDWKMIALTRNLIFFLLLVICFPAYSDQISNIELDSFIKELSGISELGYGYSEGFTGFQFLPQADSDDIIMAVGGYQAPKRSATLEKIVKQGIVAVPLLLKHLNDDRKTKIPALKGMIWQRFADEYDFNRRTRKALPKGVNKDRSGSDWPSPHTLTVGDLCFVALGQILNRDFNATRYQATGGLIVNSPTHSKALYHVLWEDWKDLTEKDHRELLAQDFLFPDHEYRRIGAYRRLAFFYPNDVESLVMKQLRTPTFDVFKTARFVRETLYPQKSPAIRKELFQSFVDQNGPASSDGTLRKLFGDLETQEADEQCRLFPPQKKKHDARNVLILLFGYPKDVKSDQKPFIDTWSATEQARFIEALVHDRSKKIDKAIHDIFLKVEKDDFLALACMKRLIGRGFDDELKAYCSRRIGQIGYFKEELEEMLTRLNGKTKNHPSEASTQEK
jgi:hypothetical protein